MRASLAPRVNTCLTLNTPRVISTMVLHRSRQANFVPMHQNYVERSVKSPKTKLQTIPHGGNRLSGHESSTSLLVQSNPSSLRRCKEENDIFRYFDDMQSIIRSRKNATIDRKRRKRNLSYDLVGVELNPGPKPGFIGPRTKAQANRVERKKTKKKARASAPARKGSSNPVSNVAMSQSASQYFATVLAPCAGNARIPDMSCLPSYLQSVEEEFTVTANAGLCAGAIVILQNVNAAPGLTYKTETAASTDSVFIYGGLLVPQVPAGVGFSRLVSACLDVMYIGSDLNNAGILVGSSNWAGEFTPTSLPNLCSGRSVGTHRSPSGISVTYRPGDSSSFDYINVSTAKTYGTLIFHASGLSTGAAFRVKLRVNYECLTATDALDLTTSSVRSPVDVVGLSHAVSTLQAHKPVVSMSTIDSLTHAMRSAFDFGKTYGPALVNAARSASKAAGVFM